MKTKEFKRLDIKENIGFIGAGNIASALIQGLLKNGSDRKKIYASSPEQDHLDSLKKLHSVNVTKSNEEVIHNLKLEEIVCMALAVSRFERANIIMQNLV